MTDWQKDYFSCQYAASGSKLNIRGIYQTQHARVRRATGAVQGDTGESPTGSFGSNFWRTESALL